MFLVRRLLWFTTGATAGFGGAMWIRRQVLRRVERLMPERVVKDAGNGLVDAVRVGRAAARGREAELRAQLRPGAGSPVVPPQLSHQGRRTPYG